MITLSLTKVLLQGQFSQPPILTLFYWKFSDFSGEKAAQTALRVLYG
jgi:hypothetical protein